MTSTRVFATAVVLFAACLNALLTIAQELRFQLKLCGSDRIHLFYDRRRNALKACISWRRLNKTINTVFVSISRESQ
ncbi:hypothetical protein [Agrobacterium tumefaciens]|uniref:hypothetical protein n=1 Tax=Agrobacterium tumefaciens TaxID=358 RepID=UPI0011776CD9